MLPPFDLRFFVLGQQKCATSWLYYCLRDHPEVAVPVEKRESLYLGSSTYRDRGPEWYFGRYGIVRAGVAVGEVAVDYIMDGRAPEIIREVTPGARFVLMIRNPIDRMVSAHRWGVRKGQFPNETLETFLTPALLEPDEFGSGSPGDPRAEMVARGFYGDLLEPYLRAFPADRFLVISYDEVSADPALTLRRIFGHIGVEPGFTPASLSRRPKRNPNIRGLVTLERLLPRRLGGVLADRLSQTFGRGGDVDSGLPVDLRSRLDELFAPRTLKTAEIHARLPPENRPDPAILERWHPSLSAEPGT